VISKTLLKTPVERIIVLETITDKCELRETCLKFLKQRQMSHYNTYINGIFIQNIPENYFISSDGTIFEGRGLFEGQHTYDQIETSYNKKSIGVSFLTLGAESSLNDRQIGALNFLIEEFINDKKLKTDYKLYHRLQLVGGMETAIFKDVKAMNHSVESRLSKFIVPKL
jgi:hypothetical protein